MGEDRPAPANPASWGDALDESDQREIRSAQPGGLVIAIPGKEPIFWSLFSAGGFVAAILLPIHVAILGIAYAAGWLPDVALSYERVLDLVRHPLTKLYLWGVVSLPLFHWAHRFRFVLHHQCGIHGWKRFIAAACYGTAIVGTVLSAWVLLSI
ncbi:MAG: fumarate reductase subunit FrdD [Actinomycetota bacterium]